MIHQSNSEADTRAVAAALAPTLAPGAVILLSGDLGAGKTAFVRGLAEGLGLDPDVVTSPTFTLVHEYRGGRLPLIHVDLYRLDRAELDEIGLDQDLAAHGSPQSSGRSDAPPDRRRGSGEDFDQGEDRRSIEIVS